MGQSDQPQFDSKPPSLADVESQLEEMELQVRHVDDWKDSSAESSIPVEANPGTSVHVPSSSANSPKPSDDPGAKSLILSTFLSLVVVLILLGVVRLILPEMLEWGRYAWTRGQLRAEYEMAGDQLRQVSLDGLSEVSKLLGQRVSPSVVHIDIRRSSSSGIDLRKLAPFEGLQVEQGSGVIIDAGGYVLTNHHVVENEGTIDILLSDGRLKRAEIIGVDQVTDLALLKIDSDGLMPIAWGDSDKMQVGMPVWAIGSPFGLAGSVTFGILSGKHRIDLSATRLQGNLKSQAEYSDLMQSDVAVNPGNSGGPLVNAKGELIGVNTAIIGESYRGVSFSIPSNVVRKVYEKLKATGKMERGVLGILVDETYRPRRTGEGVIGVRVRGFAEGIDSPALEAGIQAGDIVTQVNGKPVEDLRDLRRIVGESYVGSAIEVVVFRDGREWTFEVVIAPIPTPANEK